MPLIQEMFGNSPFGPLLEHTRKVHECIKMVKPLADAFVAEDHEEIHRLQDAVSKLEYEADVIKHEIRQNLPRRYFLPVGREELDTFLRRQDKIADAVEDFAIVLLIRKTKLHPGLKDIFFEFVDQITKVGQTLMGAAEEMQNLAETSFGGAEARVVLEKIRSLGEDEWKSDRLQRRFSIKMYELESELDPITLMFYEKFLRTLSSVANEAENTGDLLRMMIVKD